MYAHLAVHSPSDDRREDARAVLDEVGATVLDGAPGLIATLTGEEVGTGRLMAITLWHEQAEFEAVLPAIVEAIGRTEIHSWATQPAEVVRFTQLPDPA
ncbi:hypothetical protein GCM10028801_08220 [Nocardioides maradonensis]